MHKRGRSAPKKGGGSGRRAAAAAAAGGDGGLIAAYRRNTPRSARLFARSARLHVNGVSHNIRFFEPYPFVTRSARGKRLVDVDGNGYTDYWMGHWSLVLGHVPASVRAGVAAQLSRGWMHGTVSEPAIMLSDAIAKAVRAAERIRYVTSGTEATMYAVRLARGVTGKNVVAKVDGGWHGYTSDLLKTVNWPYTTPESAGLPDTKHVVSIPYNDLEGSLKILSRIRGDLAGVIIEPVLGGGGCIPARQDYLRGVQEFAHSCGALFMLDEIVTGFRFRYGCLYPTMRLDPDVVTLGKIVGGGLAIGAVCGHDEVMSHADTTRFAKEDRTYIGGGTFSANPASMTAGFETLSALKKDAGRIYPRLDRLGSMARDMLGSAFDGRAVVTGMGSLFMPHFTTGDVHDISSAADAAACDAGMLGRFHFKMIAQDGIFFLPGKLGAVSTAHTEEDIRRVGRAAAEFAENSAPASD